jgi:hypothetical protein
VRAVGGSSRRPCVMLPSVPWTTTNAGCSSGQHCGTATATLCPSALGPSALGPLCPLCPHPLTLPQTWSRRALARHDPSPALSHGTLVTNRGSLSNGPKQSSPTRPRPHHHPSRSPSLFALARRPGATLAQGLSLHGPAHGHGRRQAESRTVRMERDGANAPLHRLVSPCNLQRTLRPLRPLRTLRPAASPKARQVICTRTMPPKTNAARHMLCRLSLFRFMYLNGRKDAGAQSALAPRPERAA